MQMSLGLAPRRGPTLTAARFSRGFGRAFFGEYLFGFREIVPDRHQLRLTSGPTAARGNFVVRYLVGHRLQATSNKGAAALASFLRKTLRHNRRTRALPGGARYPDTAGDGPFCKDRELYDEERYLKCLIRRGSPICKYLGE
jgi:hypothetical protein